jgi:hypothetical protein
LSEQSSVIESPIGMIFIGLEALKLFSTNSERAVVSSPKKRTLNQTGRPLRKITVCSVPKNRGPGKPIQDRMVEHQGIAPCTSAWKVLADGHQYVSLNTYARKNIELPLSPDLLFLHSAIRIPH